MTLISRYDLDLASERLFFLTGGCVCGADRLFRMAASYFFGRMIFELTEGARCFCDVNSAR